MRKTASIVATVLLLGLAGCASQEVKEEAAPQPTVEVVEAEEAEPEPPKEMPAWTADECEEAGVALRSAKSAWYAALDAQGGDSDNWTEASIEERLAAAEELLNGKNRLTEGMTGEELQASLVDVSTVIRLVMEDDVALWMSKLKSANPESLPWQQVADLGVTAIAVGAPNQKLWDSLDTAACAP